MAVSAAGSDGLIWKSNVVRPRHIQYGIFVIIELSEDDPAAAHCADKLHSFKAEQPLRGFIDIDSEPTLTTLRDLQAIAIIRGISGDCVVAQ